MFELIKRMTEHLETMCLYSGINNKLFYYYAGMADAIRTILEEEYNWCVEQAEFHVQNMFDIMDEFWCP